MNDFSRCWKALNFIFSRHGEQKRKSANVPYVIHPIRVASILRSVGFSENEHENLMIAALCHDLLEDTDTSFEEISQNFGNDVAIIVDELSKPSNANKDEWIKSFKKKSKEAQIIKMADRIDNLLDLPSSKWTREQKMYYAKQGELILKYCGKSHVKLAEILQKTIQEVITSNEN